MRFDRYLPSNGSLVAQPRPRADGTLIDAVCSQVRESFGHKPRTHRKQTRQQYLTLAKKKLPRILKIRKAIQQQLGHLKRNLANIDAQTACGAGLLAAERRAYQKLLVGSKLVRHQNIVYRSDTRNIPHLHREPLSSAHRANCSRQS